MMDSCDWMTRLIGEHAVQGVVPPDATSSLVSSAVHLLIDEPGTVLQGIITYAHVNDSSGFRYHPRPVQHFAVELSQGIFKYCSR